MSNNQALNTRRFSFGAFCIKNTSFIVFVVMLIVAGVSTDRFYNGSNIANILRQSAPLGIMSFGMLFVILTGGIDLSVGSIMALSSVIVASCVPQYGGTISVIITLIAGMAMGAVAGLFVAIGNMAPFVATLAMMTIARGVAMIASKGRPIFIDNDAFATFGDGAVFGIPTPALALFGVFLISAFVLKYTSFGRITMAVGSNENAVVLSGINSKINKFAVYVISGGLCGLSGIIASTRTGVGSPIMGIGVELDAIAAVVIGGASLAGGRGTAFNTLLGVLVLGIISNVMNLMNIPGYHQQIVKGLIIVAAVLIEGLKERKNLA